LGKIPKGCLSIGEIDFIALKVYAINNGYVKECYKSDV
jgi:hypothetical protein